MEFNVEKVVLSMAGDAVTLTDVNGDEVTIHFRELTTDTVTDLQLAMIEGKKVAMRLHVVP